VQQTGLMERAGQSRMGWGAKLAIAFALILVGAAAAIWGLAQYQPAARFLGVAPEAPPAASQPQPQPPTQQLAQPATVTSPAIADQIAQLQARIQRVENASAQAQGSAGRADALLVAFAARRAIERGVSLGYLEPLLVSRFGAEHPQAVAVIVTASRSPVRLPELIAEYQDLESELLGPAPNEDLWTGVRRGFSSLISIRPADKPSSRPQARYRRALSHLTSGEVDSALAETMRLPGAPRARDWIAGARQYVTVRRALDEIESAALMGKSEAR
jgi:hypothetical protein